MKAAEKACQKYCRSAAAGPDPAEMAKQRDALLDYARCMRGKGVNMPDPKVSGNGGARSRWRPIGKGGDPARTRLGEPSRRRQGVPRQARRRGRAARAAARRRRAAGTAAMSVAARPRRRAAPRRAARAVASSSLAAIAIAVWLLLPGDGAAPPAANDAHPARHRDRRSGAISSTASTSTPRSATRDARKLAAPAGGTVTRLRAEGDDRRPRAVAACRSTPRRRPGSSTAPARSTATSVPASPTAATSASWSATSPRSATTPGRSTSTGPRRRPPPSRSSRRTAASTRPATLRRTDLVVSDGPARVGAHTVEVGDQARAGAPVTALSATVAGGHRGGRRRQRRRGRGVATR